MLFPNCALACALFTSTNSSSQVAKGRWFHTNSLSENTIIVMKLDSVEKFSLILCSKLSYHDWLLWCNFQKQELLCVWKSGKRSLCVNVTHPGMSFIWNVAFLEGFYFLMLSGSRKRGGCSWRAFLLNGQHLERRCYCFPKDTLFCP